MNMRRDIKLPLAMLLAACATLLSACGGSGGGLIPAGNAGPLRADFEKVAEAAARGNGDCSATEAAIARTKSDFASLPSSVSSSLRAQLSKGIAHLSSQAQLECTQPSSEGATTTASTDSTSTQSATTTTTTTTTTTSEELSTASDTSSAPSVPNGGTPAEGGENEEAGGSPDEESGGLGGAGAK